MTTTEKPVPKRISFTSHGLYTSTEAAQYIGTTMGYLSKLSCDRHIIPYYTLENRTRLYKKVDLDAYLAERGRTPTVAAVAS